MPLKRPAAYRGLKGGDGEDARKGSAPARPEERQEQKDKVEEMLAERGEDFDKFQAMKKEAGVWGGPAVRFELIDMGPIREKDGMKRVRHSRVRMFQAAEDGKEDSFLIGLDDMFLFPRGWAFTSVSPGIKKETPKK